jgi:hypothetical protein
MYSLSSMTSYTHSPSGHNVSMSFDCPVIRLGHTSKEHKPINPNLLIPRHTNILNQLLLRTNRHQRRQKPTIAPIPLMHIRRRRPIDKKLRFIENILHPLNPRRRIHIVHRARKPSPQALEAILIALRVEASVAVLLVQTLALLDDSGNFGFALGRRLLPRCRGVFFDFEAFGGWACGY